MFKPKTYLGERFQSLTVYILIIGVFFLVVMGVKALFPKKATPTSASAITGSNATIINNNFKPDEASQGLYAAIGSDRALVGVYKQINSRLEIQLGAGEGYDGSAKADVTVKVKF